MKSGVKLGNWQITVLEVPWATANEMKSPFYFSLFDTRLHFFKVLNGHNHTPPVTSSKTDKKKENKETMMEEKLSSNQGRVQCTWALD